jgi:hypothetical protein
MMYLAVQASAKNASATATSAANREAGCEAPALSLFEPDPVPDPPVLDGPALCADEVPFAAASVAIGSGLT